MYEITATLSRKRRTLKLCETDTMDDLYKQICKHTDRPDKIHSLSITKVAASQITIVAEASMKISGMMCDMIGCGEIIQKGETFYSANAEDGAGTEGLCICKHCKTRIIREEQKTKDHD